MPSGRELRERAGSGSAARGNSASDRAQIVNMFSGLESAMARGHYATACNHFSERERSQIVAGAKKAGLSSVSTCSDAFAQLIKETGITRAQLAQAFGGNGVPKIKSLSVHGDQATVMYTSASQSSPEASVPRLTSCARRPTRASAHESRAGSR
jgi:hypothetical protein